MTLVSNDPSWWPAINSALIYSYFIVACFTGVIYDWALTFGQEVEQIWRPPWSLMTVVYLSVRYIGILYAIIIILVSLPTISLIDVGCSIMYVALDWMGVVLSAILGVIMIVRLHAMYQQSRRMLKFLIVIFLVVNITVGVITAISMKRISGEELILSGTYQCAVNYGGDVAFLDSMTWIVPMVWEVLALCLAVWVVAKHFHGLRRPWTGWIRIGDCFTVLMRTHVVYFASFFVVSCFVLGNLSPTISAEGYSLETQIYYGFLQICFFVQRFVLGPRLILSVREYHAKLLADSEAATAMTSIAFQERTHASTGVV